MLLQEQIGSQSSVCLRNAMAPSYCSETQCGEGQCVAGAMTCTGNTDLQHVEGDRLQVGPGAVGGHTGEPRLEDAWVGGEGGRARLEHQTPAHHRLKVLVAPLARAVRAHKDLCAMQTPEGRCHRIKHIQTGPN